MPWLLYNLLFIIGFLGLLPRFLWRMCKRGGYAENFAQRIGLYGKDVRQHLREKPRIWIQAVSVGELFIALALIRQIRNRQPDAHFVLSTNTSTAYAIGRRQIDTRDVLIYFPVDIPPIMKHVLLCIRPRAILLIENEMWPNMIRLAHQRSIPIALINGRLSEHSFRGYQRLAFFTRRLLPMVDLFCAQSTDDAERLRLLGAPPERLHVTGSAKYDVIQPDPHATEEARQLLEAAGAGKDALMLLGGSTWPGEEEMLLEIYQTLKKKHPRLFLMLAPRHVERRDHIERLLTQKGIPWHRRSALKIGHPDHSPNAPSTTAPVFLLDTTGELKNYYAHAAVIFIGKSLTNHGGQNPIEPAFFGKAVLVGPHMENFRETAAAFEAEGALQRVQNREQLEARIDELLGNTEQRIAQGRRAAQAVQTRAGALSASVTLIEQTILPPQQPRENDPASLAS